MIVSDPLKPKDQRPGILFHPEDSFHLLSVQKENRLGIRGRRTHQSVQVFHLYLDTFPQRTVFGFLARADSNAIKRRRGLGYVTDAESAIKAIHTDNQNVGS